MSEAKYSIQQLGDAVGVTARTIRFYISKGLLPAPLTRGRNAHYGEEHLRRLQEILREKGSQKTLGQIQAGTVRLEDFEVTPVPWLLVQTAPDAVVMTRADVPPWRRHQLNQAINAFAVATAVAEDEEKK